MEIKKVGPERTQLLQSSPHRNVHILVTSSYHAVTWLHARFERMDENSLKTRINYQSNYHIIFYMLFVRLEEHQSLVLCHSSPLFYSFADLF